MKDKGKGAHKGTTNSKGKALDKGSYKRKGKGSDTVKSKVSEKI